MSLVLIESFEAINDIEDKYNVESVSGVNTDASVYRTGSRSLKCNANYFCQIPVPASPTGVIGLAPAQPDHTWLCSPMKT